jgi:hypothetical protein
MASRSGKAMVGKRIGKVKGGGLRESAGGRMSLVLANLEEARAMAEFTKPTGARRKRLLEATGAMVAAGHTIASGAPELPELKKWAGLEDATAEERDWAFQTWLAEQAKAAPQAKAAGAGEAALGGPAGPETGAVGKVNPNQPPEEVLGRGARLMDRIARGSADLLAAGFGTTNGGGFADPDPIAPLANVFCARCNRQVDSVDQVLPHKVYVTCHGERQGVPSLNDGPLIAFTE